MPIIEFEIGVELFSKVLDVVSSLKAEPTVVFDPEGVAIVTMDSAKVILLQFVIKKSVFEEYYVDERYKASFDVETLAGYLRGTKGVGTFNLERELVFMIPAKYGFKTFTIPLLAEYEASLVPSKIPYESRCKIDLGSFDEAIKDAKKVDSEFIWFYVAEDGLDAVTKSEKGKSRSTIEYGKGIIKAEFTEKSKFVVATKNFDIVVKLGLPFTSMVLTEFSEKLLPIKFDFQVPFEGQMRAYLAPINDPDEFKEETA